MGCRGGRVMPCLMVSRPINESCSYRGGYGGSLIQVSVEVAYGLIV